MSDEVAVNECPVCAHAEHKSLETQVLKGQITKRELADIVGCRVDTVYNHMTQHLIRQSLTDTESKRNVLLNSIQKISDNLEHLVQEQQHGPIANKQLIQLASEIRHTIMDLNILEGHAATEQHVTIQEYNDFRSIIINKIDALCPKCRKLLLEDLEEKKKETIDVEFSIKT